MRRCWRERGLTLIELLVGLAVLGMLAGVGYAAVGGVVRSETMLTVEHRELRALQRVFALLEDDLVQLVAPGWAPPESAVILVSPDHGLELLRNGNDGPEPATSLPHAVHYRLVGTGLWRARIVSVNADNGTDARPARLFDGLGAFTVQAMDTEGSWFAHWPTADATRRRAVALKVSLSTERWGELYRVFPINVGSTP